MSYDFVGGPSKHRGTFRPRLGRMAQEQNTDLTTETEGQDHGVRLPPDPAIRKLAKRGRGEFMAVVKEHPPPLCAGPFLPRGRC